MPLEIIGTTAQSWNELSECDQLATIYSDVHKEAYGVRPRHTDHWTTQDYRDELASLNVIIADNRVHEAEAEKKAIEEFEYTVTSLIGRGAKDRETAIRWLMDGIDAHGDKGYLCYTMGLPYSYLRD